MQKLATLAAGLFLLAACSEKPLDKPSITINATGVEDGEVTLTLPGADSVYSKAMLKEGKATLEADLEYPQLVAVNVEGLETPVVYYADLTQMTIDLDATGATPDFTISGSTFNDSLEAFGDKQNENREFMNSLRQPYSEAMQANDSLTLFIINQQADSSYNAFNEYTLAFAQRNGLLGTMVAQRFLYDMTFTDMQSIYENVPVRYKNAEDAVRFKERMDIVEKTQVGKRFIDITQNDTTGAPLSISEINGKYILIDFWASWCGPCRQANPSLVEIHNDYKDKGFQIVGVSLDQKAADWKKAIVDDQLNWPQMSDLKGWQNEGAAAYAIRAIPQSVIIDEQGFIVNKNLTPEELRAFLEDKL